MKVTARCAVCADDGALWAWLARVARNAFIDQRRARTARKRRVIPMNEDALECRAAEVRDTALRAGFREILDALAPAERELLQAAYVDEQPLAEIAADAGTTYKALESKLGRLRARVRERLLKLLRHESD